MSKSETIALSADEALILFDLLGRWLEDAHSQTVRAAVEDDSEIWALNSLYCALERILTEPFAPEYRTIVVKAQERLRRAYGESPWPTIKS